MNLTKYVAGFVFSPDSQAVALIRKNKPEWQKGKLNGIGGKIEEGEDPLAAMVREFHEEAKGNTQIRGWNQFLVMGDDRTFEVTFFAAFGNVDAIESAEEEKIEVVPVAGIHPLRTDMIENIPWLVALAIDHLSDGRPKSATIIYP